MNKAYNRIEWENKPSLKTPLNETNLNNMDAAIDEIDNRVIALDTTKPTKTEVSTMIADVSFSKTTGIFTFTRKNGSQFTVDTLLEKVIVNFDFDRATQKLIIHMEDGTTKEVDMSAIVTQYEFLDSGTIAFAIDSDGKVTAIVKEGSIEEKHLRPNYLADIKVEVVKAEQFSDNAKTSANEAKDARDVAEDYKDLTKTYSDAAIDAVEQVNKKIELAEFDVNDNGELVYTDSSSYLFTVNDDGYLEWEVA